MIEKLFTSKNRVKLLEFFLFREKESYLRDIERKLKIPISAVKNEVDNLISLGILLSSSQGITLNESCIYIDDLKNIFIKTDYIVYPLQETFKKVDADFVFIFGSFAQGNFAKESDIDVIVIGTVKPFELYKKIKPFENIIKRDINPVVWTIDHLKKEKKSSFVKDIFKKRIIMIKGDEHELRKVIA
ncbi:MAG: hypothetical protein RL557_1014 [archaeon]|jgi:predicted nucleotidyltransferase